MAFAGAAPWNRPGIESLIRTRVLWPVGSCCGSANGVVEGGVDCFAAVVALVVAVVVVVVAAVVVVVNVSGNGVAVASLMASVVISGFDLEIGAYF